RVAGGSGANFFVSWIFFFSAGVTGQYFFHAVERLINGFRAPKTAAAKRGEFRFCESIGGIRRCVHIQREKKNQEQERICDIRYTIYESPVIRAEIVNRKS